MDNTIETVRIAANGLEFDVDTAGSGRKLALCLHGFPESRFSWRFQLPLLARLGYTAWAPDLRGYGHSSRPQGVENYRASLLLRDVAGLIDAARARGIDDGVLLIGHDWGGALGWLFVLNRVRPVERFIVMNLPHPDLFARGLRRWRQLRRSWYIFWLKLPWLPERVLAADRAAWIARVFRGLAVDKSRFPDEVLEVYRANALIPGALTAMINWYRANLRNPWRRLAPAKRLAVPTLMIWGEVDPALGFELTEGTAALVDDFTFRSLPDVSHWVQQEAPESVNAMIEAWLEGREVPFHPSP
ncbi:MULTISPECIES: alpha/beta fold hydrolase [unclassified Acidiphilium]|uniref:alpha/beta fold hydrolase n=1 Tax=unclassified Acidiphilium TaxID=2617493 RepID=UPI000BD0EBFC|nr:MULTISPECIES: alpha/beta hydrolase [unclassified Acidiphilium]OYV56206.1 MAG: epoxide hydrolase [Acidiphilium sp. 20-67-58]HQT61375.1 alpha/beta hydrolase [Acidiphilium sp.]